MLALTRKPGESVRVAGNIVVTVVSVRGTKVRLAFDAPAEVPIYQSELHRIPSPAGDGETMDAILPGLALPKFGANS